MSITISLSGEAKCSLKIPDDLLYTLLVLMMTQVQSNKALWETIAYNMFCIRVQSTLCVSITPIVIVVLLFTSLITFFTDKLRNVTLVYVSASYYQDAFSNTCQTVII